MLQINVGTVFFLVFAPVIYYNLKWKDFFCPRLYDEKGIFRAEPFALFLIFCAEKRWKSYADNKNHLAAD